MKKIFITGVAGFLGSHLADAFLKKGYIVRGCDNLIGGELINVPCGVEFYNRDLINLKGLSHLMSGCDIVYHTACTAYEGLSVFSPSLVVSNTIQISVNTFTAAIQAGANRFVHCSSMARYGTHDNIYTETTACKPQDPYGIAKYSTELLLQNLSQVHGIDLVIAVPHNIIGPRQKYDDPFRNVASIMSNLMLQNRQPIIYGDGMQTRCFTDVEDIIASMIALAEDDRAVGQIFNVGPDNDTITILELAKKIANQLGFNLDPIFVAARPQEVKHAICSSDKIKQYFNYSTTITLDESLTKLIEYIQRNGVKQFKYHLPIEIVNDKTPLPWKNKLF